MSWTKFGDEYPAEARELTDAEWRTHGEALMWSNFRLLDLHIPKRDVRRFAEYDSPVDIDVVVGGLVRKGWWRDDDDSWYIGLVHPEWQRDSDEVRTDRAKAAARMKRVRRHKSGDHSLCDASSCEDAPVLANVRGERAGERSAHVRDPVPSRPDPVLPYGRTGASFSS
jgi:hypothetical protein